MKQEEDMIVSQADPAVPVSVSLRLMADWIENFEKEHLELAREITFLVWATCSDQDKVAEWVRALGTANKQYYETCIELSRYFGQIRVGVNIQRSAACTKKVIGTRTIPAHVVKYPESIQEIVEWECRPLLETMTQDHSASV